MQPASWSCKSAAEGFIRTLRRFLGLTTRWRVRSTISVSRDGQWAVAQKFVDERGAVDDGWRCGITAFPEEDPDGLEWLLQILDRVGPTQTSCSYHDGSRQNHRRE